MNKDITFLKSNFKKQKNVNNSAKKKSNALKSTSCQNHNNTEIEKNSNRLKLNLAECIISN